jgi:hypothetical protein
MHFSDEAPDSKTGLIMGDFESERVSGHEGRSAGKTDPPGVEKSMLFFSETEDSSGDKPIVSRTVSRKGQCRKA